jgi:hypothetical protein
MNKTLKIFLFTSIFIISLLALSFYSTSSHEQVHYDIATYAGCNAYDHTHFFKQSYTLTSCPENISMNSAELAIYQADVELELFDYKLNEIMNTLAMIGICILFILFLDKILDKD